MIVVKRAEKEGSGAGGMGCAEMAGGETGVTVFPLDTVSPAGATWERVAQSQGGPGARLGQVTQPRCSNLGTRVTRCVRADV